MTDENAILNRVNNSFPTLAMEYKLLLVSVIQQEIIWNELSKKNDIHKDRIAKIENYDYVKEKIAAQK